MGFKVGDIVRRIAGENTKQWRNFNPNNETVKVQDVNVQFLTVRTSNSSSLYNVLACHCEHDVKATQQLSDGGLVDLSLSNNLINKSEKQMKKTTVQVTTKTVELTEKEVRIAVAQYAGLDKTNVEDIALNVKGGKVVSATYIKEESCSSQD